MAVLTVQDAPVTGLSPIVFSAADALGDDVATGSGVVLLVRNDDVSATTVTVDTPGTVRGLDIENPAVSVAAGDHAAIPMIRQVFGATAAITYTSETSLFVAAIRVAR